VPGQHEQPRPARAYWLTDEAVRVAAGCHSANRPGLDPASAEAAEKPPDPRQEPHEPAGESSMVTAAEADESLLALLASATHGGLTVEELAGHIGRKRTWVYDRLSAHARAGRVARVGPGRWRARNAGGRP
jgi:DNA segregation ATPase FtsK/SpoIIIE, S-DNA-T family